MRLTYFRAARASSVLKFEFRGSAHEYFGIWIVNILLTIVTLGIYSAWAKVRRLQYFYGNTVLDGFRFDYHAKGKQILVGRLIAFAYLVAYNIAINLSPIIGGVLGLGFLVLLPWIIVRSLRFIARVTSYRNLRFDFVGGAWGAFRSFFLGGLVAGLSLGILAPFASRWAYRYVINNLRYGGKPFSTDVRVGQIYRGWPLPALMFLVGAAILAVVGAVTVFPYIAEIQQNTMGMEQNRRIAVMVSLFYLAMLPVALLYMVAGIVYRIGVRNIVLSHSEIDGGHRLSSAVPRFGCAWVAISNVVVTMATLSLMRPWAAVREWRYVVERTGLQPNGDLTTIVKGLQSEGSAASSELLDVEGFDFGF